MTGGRPCWRRRPSAATSRRSPPDSPASSSSRRRCTSTSRQTGGASCSEGVDALGRRLGIPLHATGLGHLYGLQWAEERVVDHRTRMNSDAEKIANVMLGLLNEGVYQYSFGTLLIGASHGDAEIEEFLGQARTGAAQRRTRALRRERTR